MKRLLVLVAAAPFAFGAASTAYAQPAAAASAEADALFDQGRTLLDANKIAEACAAFDASQKLSPAVSTLFNQANCREKNHQLATAYGLFREAERQTRAPIDPATQKLNRVATERVKALEPRLSKLTISVQAPVGGLEILRDETVIDAGAWGHPLPVDGGVYRITARANGYQPWTSTIELDAEGDAKALEVPALVKLPEAAASSQAKRSKLPALIVASGSVALLGGALATDYFARRDFDSSAKEADNVKQSSLFNSAKTKRYVAQGMAVAGLGAAGVAVWLYLRSGSDTETASIARIGKTEVHPAVSADGAGIQLFRSF